MKRLLIVLLILVALPVYAGAKKNVENMPEIKFNGSHFSLFYSVKNEGLGGFLNEYYKPSQTFTNWNELIAVQKYSEVDSPIRQARNFQEYFFKKNIDCSIIKNEENNTAIVDFTILDKRKLPILIEFNVFKFVPSSDGKVLSLQYVKRYKVNNPLDVDKIVKNIKKSKKKILKKIDNLDIPEVITENVENGKYIRHEGTDQPDTEMLN